MEKEFWVHWGTVLDGDKIRLDHPNCDLDFWRRAVLVGVLEPITGDDQKVVTIQARDPYRRGLVSGDVWVDGETEQRQIYRFLKVREGRSIECLRAEYSAFEQAPETPLSEEPRHQY